MLYKYLISMYKCIVIVPIVSLMQQHAIGTI